ncbi:unnamed protein product [Cylindrotheca closterium]|uniref:Uncharacterized protein n=1 Tax=Cylindrotheca closterium TaxID=2856 RepID=A0AAD2FRG2_9STRA|nr:unnamed protein product [Cylindrotheca closterium]
MDDGEYYQPEPDPECRAEFMQMDEMKVQQHHVEILQEEVEELAMRGKRLRSAAVGAGICQSVAVLCSSYLVFAIRWMLLDWDMIDKTIYNIQSNWIFWNVGVLAEIVGCVSNTLVGVLVGMIMIGAGVNPASCSLIILFKLMEQVIVAIAIIAMIMVGIFVYEDNAMSTTIKYYFYSDSFPQIGMQISFFLLLLNKYGIIFSHVFAGLHYSFLGFIVHKFGVFPHKLGKAMLLAGPCYIINAGLNLLISRYNDQLHVFFALPGILVQFWLASWLLINTPSPSKNRETVMKGFNNM